MKQVTRAAALALFAASLPGACQMTENVTPAVLADDDGQTMAALKSALTQAVGRAQIELGAGDPTRVASVAVLPPRPATPDDRSPAMPELFDLVLRGQACYAIHRKSGEAYELTGVTCIPAPDAG